MNIQSGFYEISGGVFSMFKPNKDVSGNPLTTNITISGGTYVTTSLPQGSTFRLAWTGVGPFSYRTGSTVSISATPNDIKVISGVIEVQSFGQDNYISIYGIGPGYCNITGGTGG